MNNVYKFIKLESYTISTNLSIQTKSYQLDTSNPSDYIKDFKHS